MSSIIFVHGAGATPRSFNYVRAQLGDTGHDHYDFAYDTNAPCRLAIDALKALIASVSGPVYLVGHSLGGVVSVNAAYEATAVRGVVTLSSPLGGVPAAQYLRWIFTSTLLDELSPYSSNIRNTLSRQPSCPVRSIVTFGNGLPFSKEESDGVVPTASQSALAYAEKIRVNTNHFEVLLSDEVVGLIRDFVTSAN